MPRHVNKLAQKKDAERRAERQEKREIERQSARNEGPVASASQTQSVRRPSANVLRRNLKIGLLPEGYRLLILFSFDDHGTYNFVPFSSSEIENLPRSLTKEVRWTDQQRKTPFQLSFRKRKGSDDRKVQEYYIFARVSACKLFSLV